MTDELAMGVVLLGLQLLTGGIVGLVGWWTRGIETRVTLIADKLVAHELTQQGRVTALEVAVQVLRSEIDEHVRRKLHDISGAVTVQGGRIDELERRR